MSDPAEPAAAKPKRSFVRLAGLGVVMAGIGGGTAFGLSAAGVIGNHEEAKVDHRPQLVKKGEEDPYAPPAAEGAEGEGGGEEAEEEGSGGSPYRVAYYSFADEFTSNLKESDGLVQLSLAASTRRDGRVLRRLARHELAIRSAVLVVLADTPEPGIDTVAGKARLQKRLGPTIDRVNAEAFTPYAAGTLNAEAALAAAAEPFHAFMIGQTRKSDLKMFATMAKHPPFAGSADVPFTILLPAFVTSELKTAFQIGFMLFLPFLAIDLVVSSVLMSLGMMMMSPTIVSLPFKLLLFVLVDGWALLMGSLAASFGGG